LLWAAHVVHHQSEDYNLAVALRQAILTSWTGLPFYLPLALAGVPPLVYASMLAFSTLYHFWIHTKLVGKGAGRSIGSSTCPRIPACTTRSTPSTSTRATARS
jgi:sterol desaturase/sphingolipid hydroxylase (fatty acid hydroxylase superfamily)